jgi:cobalt-zinc-cadmium efflux system outer membrane protein
LLRPNPRLILQQENLRPYQSPNYVYLRETDSFAYLQNTLETAGKREARAGSAEAGIAKSEAERELLRRQIVTRVVAAYWAAAGAAHVVDLLAENERNFARIVDYHAVRVREGSMAEADLLRVTIEAQRLRIERNRAALEAERARIHLQREMARTEFPALRFSEELRSDLPDYEPVDVAAVLARRPEVRLARSVVESARAQERVQVAAARPNVDFLFGYKRTGGVDTMLGGVQVDLPVRNRNQGNVAAASAETRAAESALAATQALIRAEVESAVAEYRQRRSDVASVLRPLVDQAVEGYRIAEAAYREGGADLLRLLDAQRVQIEARISYARALAELRLSEAALQAALGVEP